MNRQGEGYCGETKNSRNDATSNMGNPKSNF